MFIDARKLGVLIDRVHRELMDNEIERIARTYHAWRREKGAGDYQDVPGFCKSVSLEEIRERTHMLPPGRYVEAEDIDDDGEPFEEKMKRLVAKLEEQFGEGARLEEEIRRTLKEMSLGV